MTKANVDGDKQREADYSMATMKERHIFEPDSVARHSPWMDVFQAGGIPSRARCLILLEHFELEEELIFPLADDVLTDIDYFYS